MAESAFVVRDDWQNHNIGSLLPGSEISDLTYKKSPATPFLDTL